ncbi:hypothetical protein [Rhizobium sp. AG855]|uniref:hypothetical protein n=1 Tax=Rhizobium sp. AG855 TaxID=2183898 RepID=UPI000E732C2A|nr:hypothetical protein [Rhizobium sp. AG855]RKE85541.1 oligosaccharide repeat unit polymerase [Rhizobium sp. AG855]
MMSIFSIIILLGASVALMRPTSSGFLNPALVMLIAWLPALALTMTPVTAALSIYAYLSDPPTNYTLALLSLALFCVAVGAYTVNKVDLPKTLQNLKPFATKGDFVIPAAYAIGLSTFLYAYWNSGLLSAFCGTPTDVAAAQQQLHIRHVSLLVALMDLSAIAIAARMFQTGKTWLIFPAVFPIFLYLLTLQKSRVLFLILCLMFVAIIFQKESRQMFLSSVQRALSFAAIGIVLVLAMYATNVVRGVGVLDPNSAGTICKGPLAGIIVRSPTGMVPGYPGPFPSLPPGGSFFVTESRTMEQVFIYVGAPAIRNFAATIHGVVSSDAPTYGRIALRTFLWPFVDRATLNPSRHLGGINNGTALIFYWHDFGLSGIVLFSALAGMLAQVAFRLAQRRSLLGILLGAIAFNACVMSVFTDMFFEPLTLVQIFLSLVLHFLSVAQTRLSGSPRWLAKKERSSAKAIQ